MFTSYLVLKYQFFFAIRILILEKLSKVFLQDCVSIVFPKRTKKSE